MQSLVRLHPVGMSRSLFTSTSLISALPATSGKKVSAVAKPADTLALLDQQQKAAVSRAVADLKAFDTMVKNKSKLWNEMHEVYYGKERDLEKFPVPKIPESHPKVRMGFVPDSFFQAFYNKTGVTGPYLFIYGGLTYLLSKEILILDHELDELVLLSAFVFGATKLVGPKIAALTDKLANEQMENIARAPVRSLKTQAENMIRQADELIHNEQGQKYLFQAKRENVDLQLELAYRSRIDQLHRAVKARLDYQVEKENTRRNFQQQHMVNWIVDNVLKGVTPQQEKDILSQCIKDLQSIAKRQPQATA